MFKHKFFFQKRYALTIALLLLGCLLNPCMLLSQESVLFAYQQNFTRASLAAKPEILFDAATDYQSSGFIGHLYEYALVFVLNNAELLGDDPQMIYLAAVAARGAGATRYTGSINTLWTVFMTYRDSSVRTEVLKALAVLGKGNPLVIGYINRYLSEQNNLRFSQPQIDYTTISAAISVLAELGDSSSFAPVFGAIIADYSVSITNKATAALNSLSGDYRQFLLDIVLYKPPAEKFAAFKAGAANMRFTLIEQGQFAQIALEQGLDYQALNIQEGNMLASLRYAAAVELTRLQWTQAEHLVIRHFYRVQNDYFRSYATKERYLEGIACLGAMGSSEAAVQAALQLGLINSQVEKTRNYDPDITLALIRVLGIIRDSSTADPLFSIEYLPYSKEIKTAAKEAINSLRW